MKEVIRKHVQDELVCLGENRDSVKELGEMIKRGEYTPTREYLTLLKRVVKIQGVINGTNEDIKKLYVLRYKKRLSWVAVALALNVSEGTAKRYNHKLIELIAIRLGWM